MEMIPEAVSYKGKTYNPRKEDLPMPVVFLCPSFVALEIGLIPADGKQDPHTGIWERVPNTGLRIKFKGGALTVKNKFLLQMIMEHPLFTERGKILIDPECEFWQHCGAAKIEPIVTHRAVGLGAPKFTEVDWEAVKTQVKKKAEAEKKEPAQVA